MTRRDKLLVAASFVAVPVALVLIVLAIDVLRTPGWISQDDSRFASAPIRGSGLWNEPGLLATRARLAWMSVGATACGKRFTRRSALPCNWRPRSSSTCSFSPFANT